LLRGTRGKAITGSACDVM